MQFATMSQQMRQSLAIALILSAACIGNPAASTDAEQGFRCCSYFIYFFQMCFNIILNYYNLFVCFVLLVYMFRQKKN